jgi:hypothetical protein
MRGVTIKRWVRLCPGIVAASLFSALAFSSGFETGIIQRSDGGAFQLNSIPAVARLESGKLLAVWSVFAKPEWRGRIVASFSMDSGRTWSEPRELIKTPGMADADPNILVDGRKVFVYSTTIPAEMKRITGSKVFMTSSDDEGATWTKPVEIPLPYKYFVGKVQNGIKLMDGTLAMGFSWDLWAQNDMPASSEGEMNLASGVLLSKDGIHWTPFGQIYAWLQKITPFSTNGLSEPALVQLANGDLLMIMRTGTTFHWESRSHDGGLSWDPPRPSTVIGHNNPVSLWRLDQKPEEIIVVFNNSPIHRWPLSVGISADGGIRWSKPRDIAVTNNLDVSYPGITQAQDGTFVAVWQLELEEGVREEIHWARFTRAWVLGEEP